MSASPAASSAAVVDAIMGVMDHAFDPDFGEAWNRNQVQDALLLPNTHAFLVDQNGQCPQQSGAICAGFVLSRHAADEEELLLIAVRPDAQGSGLGKVLIEQLFQTAAKRGVTQIFLEMRRGNPAIHLYEKVGFKPIGERSNYYKKKDGTRIDAITFARAL